MTNRPTPRTDALIKKQRDEIYSVTVSGLDQAVELIDFTRDLERENAELREALKYARRFLNDKDHDVAFVDSVIAKAEEATHE